MKVTQIMTKRVLTLKPTDTIYDAIRTFSEKGISGAPVINSANKVIGVISDADITKSLGVMKPEIQTTSSKLISMVFASLRTKKEKEILTNELCETKNIKIKDIMSQPITISKEATVLDVVQKMATHKINRLPVTDEKNKLLGIVARGDIIKALAKQ